jgi:REP element-mobilizing transposase RayT
MQLSATGKFANENLQDISHHYPYAEIPLWVVMPNHIKDGARNKDGARPVSINEKMQFIDSYKAWLSVVIGGFKSAVTKFANENGVEFVWQTRFHDRIIRNQEEMNRIADYIENNPARWDMDCFNLLISVLYTLWVQI